MKSQRLVVDSAVIMAWYFEDETSEIADAALRILEHGEAVVPALWPLEFGNALLVAERRGRLTSSDTARILELARNSPISVEQESPGRMLTDILALAR